jgi:hypothetical protein
MRLGGWLLWLIFLLLTVSASVSTPMVYHDFIQGGVPGSWTKLLITGLIFTGFGAASAIVRFMLLPHAIRRGKLDPRHWSGRARILIHFGFAWFLALLFAYGGLTCSIVLHDLQPVLFFGPAALLLNLIEFPRLGAVYRLSPLANEMPQ